MSSSDRASAAWRLDYDDDENELLVSLVEIGGEPGCLRSADERWVELARIRMIEAWIDAHLSGVRAHLDDGSQVELMHHDSGNIDWTATWNEYLYDGGWAFGAGKQLARWLGVPYWDAWLARRSAT